MDTTATAIGEQCQDNKSTIERRNSFVSIPYHHNFNLQQLFDTCRVCITAVEQSLQSTLHRPVLSRRLDTVDESFKSISAEFSSNADVPDNSSYLLIIILKEVYELLRDHVEKNCPPISNVIEFSAPGGIVILTRIPHGQVNISIEKLVEELDLSEEETERLDEFIYRRHRRIAIATENTSPLERIVTATEMWTDQLVALTLYTFPRHTNGMTNSVKIAFERIKFLFAEKELHPDSPMSHDETSPSLRSEMFFWHELSSGGDGTGKVYKIRAKDSFSPQGDFYACKVIRQARSIQVNSERKAILTICKGQHPNIVEVIDTWTERTSFKTTCYIQMELCKGDLHYFLRRRYTVDLVPLTSTEIWEVFRQIVAGIGYIHSLGMMHRDIKPKNILYTTDASSNLVWKITDFGFSSMNRSPLPKTLSFGRMTRNYFAPELLISSRYDSKVDIWSAGCILYELAIGSPAFANDEAVRRYVWSGDDPPKASKIRDNLGSEIDEMISVMLNVSSELRPDAKAVLEGIPLSADVSLEL